MMKNEQGQIVFMSTGQHGGIPTQQTSTSALQGKVNIQTIKVTVYHNDGGNIMDHFVIKRRLHDLSMSIEIYNIVLVIQQLRILQLFSVANYH